MEIENDVKMWGHPALGWPAGGVSCALVRYEAMLSLEWAVMLLEELQLRGAALTHDEAVYLRCMLDWSGVRLDQFQEKAVDSNDPRRTTKIRLRHEEHNEHLYKLPETLKEGDRCSEVLRSQSTADQVRTLDVGGGI
jgi:hypothetical protein